VRMGRDLAAAHPKATTFHEVPGAHHNDILSLTRGQIGQAMTALVP